MFIIVFVSNFYISLIVFRIIFNEIKVTYIFTFSNSKMLIELYNLNSLTDDLQYTIEYPRHDGSLPYMDILIPHPR